MSRSIYSCPNKIENTEKKKKKKNLDRSLTLITGSCSWVPDWWATPQWESDPEHMTGSSDSRIMTRKQADECLYRCLNIWEGAKKSQTEQKLYQTQDLVVYVLAGSEIQHEPERPTLPPRSEELLLEGRVLAGKTISVIMY